MVKHPLEAFWHRSRKTFVPLTADEWTRKAGVCPATKRDLAARGLAENRTERFGQQKFSVWEITAEGRAELARAWGQA